MTPRYPSNPDYDFNQEVAEDRQPPQSHGQTQSSQPFPTSGTTASGKAAAEELVPLIEVFRIQLLACLEECAHGRIGLFCDLEHLAASSRPWPEAAKLRDLAAALQAILSQQETSDTLCDQFLDLCSIHGDNNPGEPRLAREFLNHIGS